MTMKFATPLGLLASAAIIAGCQSQPSSPHSEEVQALIDRTLNNMVFVEGGSFMMGDIGYEIPDDEPGGAWVTLEDGRQSYRKPFGCSASCYPVHKVTLSGYYLNKLETTYGEYDVYTEANGMPLTIPEFRDNEGISGPNRPVRFDVNWYEAQAYCLWLGELTGLPFDLPTEAQWEYAARSRGLAVRYATDNGELDLGRNYRPKGHPRYLDPPGTYPPNPLGLYDMTGNANEWTRDWHDPFYYENSPEFNPTGPADDDLFTIEKVSRGFGIVNSDWSANLLFRRIPDDPNLRGAGNGFRCAIHSDAPLPKR